MGKRTKSRSLINTVATALVISVAGVAIAEQLRRPPEERTWHGDVFGIPYDFRIPTKERLRNTFWNNETSNILVPHAFGIGWSLNLYPIIHPKTQQA